MTMPARYFAPVAGFTDKNIVAIRVETVEGYPRSDEIYADGTAHQVHSVGANQISVPVWSEAELLNLCAAGTWKEIENPVAAAPKQKSSIAETMKQGNAVVFPSAI